MKIVIVGGVAGGASAAVRARRLSEQAEIVLLQSGPDVSYASCGMPYFLGGEILNRDQMAVQTPETLFAKFNIDIRVKTRVTRINIDNKTVEAKNEDTSEKTIENYDELILAVGAKPFKPPIPGINLPSLFTLRSLEDMDTINQYIVELQQMASVSKQQIHCVIAGAGFIGLEMVEQLTRRNIKLSLVEMLPQVLGSLDVEMASIIEEDLLKRGIEVVTGDGIKKFEAQGDTVNVHLASGKVLLQAHMTILGFGIIPDTAFIQEAGIACTKRGHVIVDDSLKTNVAGIWAIGDAVQVRNPIVRGEKGEKSWCIPLAGPANRQGRMVADNIFAMNRKYKGTFAASVLRSFDLFAASVGMNEKLLQKNYIQYAVVHVHPGSHAGYYPGAKPINLKLIFDPKDGYVFGAQAVGEDGVDKRIDVISTAMQGGLSVADLAELELCYAPPVGSAKDPVNIAGMAAQNVVEGIVQQIQWYELEALRQEPETVFVDVRGSSEVASTELFVPEAKHIPLPELRSRMNELSKDSKIVVSCASGQRSYYAFRILSQNGFCVYNLSGAYKTLQKARSLSSNTNFNSKV